jgi:hypothetical protein
LSKVSGYWYFLGRNPIEPTTTPPIQPGQLLPNRAAKLGFHTGYLAVDSTSVSLPIIEPKITLDPIAVLLEHLETPPDDLQNLGQFSLDHCPHSMTTII